jgi:hypothetical protein
MRILQDVIEHTLHSAPAEAAAALVGQKLAAQGVKLSPRERALLAEQIFRGGNDSFYLRRWKWWEHGRVALEFTREDIEQIERTFTEFVQNHLPEIIQKATVDLSRNILSDLKAKWKSESRRQRRELAGFKKRLYERWEVPIEGLRMLVTISRELGDTINQELAHSTESAGREHLIDVTLRLHARACQITEEVICLLEGGFADGAMARWRTLHEVAVVATFISEHGEDLAQHYMLHNAVESNRAMHDYRQCQTQLGYDELDDSDVKTLLDSYDAVIAQFGKDFGKGDYGWAGHHLGISKPTFKDIERAAGIGHLRAHYRMASHNVHANPKGVFVKLGLVAIPFT